MDRTRALFIVALFSLASFAPAEGWVVGVGTGAFPITAGTPTGHHLQAVFVYDAKGANVMSEISEVVFGCLAVATPTASTTSIEACYVTDWLGGVNPALGSGLNYPGPLATATGAAVIVGGQANGCIDASALFIENTWGPYDLSTGLVCKPLNLVFAG